MRRAMHGIAAVAIGFILASSAAACIRAVPRWAAQPPSTNGIGPITLAIGKDNSGWVQHVVAGWNQRYPGQKVTPLLHARATARPAGRAGGRTSRPKAAVRRMSTWTSSGPRSSPRTCGWIIRCPKASSAEGFPQGQPVDTAAPGTACTPCRLQQRGPALLPQGHPRQAGQRPPKTWAQLARLKTSSEIRPGRVRPARSPIARPHHIASPRRSVSRRVHLVRRRQQDHRGLAPGSGEAAVPGRRIPAWLDRGHPSTHHEEESSQAAFGAGKFLFLDNWPDVYAALSRSLQANKVYGSVLVHRCLRPRISRSTRSAATSRSSAYSKHQRT